MVNISAVINQLDLKPGDIVADLGSGIGHFTLPIAKKIGDKGVVYAVDIHKEVLTRLSNDAKHAGITNVQTIWGNIEDPGETHIKNEGVDIAIFVNILSQVNDRPATIREALRIIKDNGKLAVVDWQASSAVGPRKEKRVPFDEIKRLCERFGLVYTTDISVGDYHYGMMFSKR